MRIGILITPFISEEVWKIETITIDNRRPWLSDVPSKYRVNINGKEHVSDDVAIAFCLKHKLKGSTYEVDIISPLEPDAYERVQKTNITFLIIYDKLEAFHTLPDERYQKIKAIMDLPNIYPSQEYQHFVNHKDIYYNYFRTKGVPVLPNIYISNKEYATNPDSAIVKIMGLERGDYGKIIGKPIFGQESIDFREFNPPFSTERFERYLEKIFLSYDGVIFQPFIEALQKKSEYKVMFFGDTMSYIAKFDGANITMYTPDAPEITDIVKFANKVFLHLPILKFRDKEVNRLISRVDVGCCYGERQYFVSEIEFVPSLFAPEVQEFLPNKLIDADIVHEMMKILDQIKGISLPLAYPIAPTPNINVQIVENEFGRKHSSFTSVLYILLGCVLTIPLCVLVYIIYTPQTS